MWYAECALAFSRVLFSPSRTYVNAVSRNKIKRQAREIFRNVKFKVKPGYDMIFLFYPGEYTFQERHDQLIGLLHKSKLFGEV